MAYLAAVCLNIDRGTAAVILPWHDTVRERRGIVGEFDLATSFRFGGMPFDLAEDGLDFYAKELLPVLHSWNKAAVAQAAE
jgi:hypothetical protein